MDRIESHLKTGSAEYQANRAAMEAAVTKLRSTIDRIREGGGEIDHEYGPVPGPTCDFF